METETRVQLEKHIKELPKGVQAMLVSNEVAQHIGAIGKEHQLHIDKLQAFEDEVLLFISGVTDGEGLVSALANEVGFSEEAVPEVIKELDERVFEEIRRKTEPQEKNQVEEMGSEVPTKTEGVPTDKPDATQEDGSEENLQSKDDTKNYAVDPYREPIE